MTRARAVILALAFAFLCVPARAKAPAVRMTEPRAFGHFIGDVLVREADVFVDAAQRISSASLPRPGPLAYWLDLRSVDLSEMEAEGDRRRYRLRLEYQTFYAPLEPKKLEIPRLVFRLSNGGTEAENVFIPAFSFLSSPLREIVPEKRDAGDEPASLLRPDSPPLLLSTFGERLGLWISSGAVFMALALVLRHFAFWPFQRRPSRPFTAAARAVRREAAKNPRDADYRAALLALHRAFDASARRRVLADDVTRFLRERPEFEPLREDIGRFFAGSRQAFFADEAEGTRRALPLARLDDLATALGERERAGP